VSHNTPRCRECEARRANIIRDVVLIIGVVVMSLGVGFLMGYLAH
jgi:hypothetical protein